MKLAARAIIFFGFFVALAACEANPRPGSATAITRAANDIVRTGEGLRDYLSDTTTKGYSRQHGTQIGYFGADGTHYLVYPGNKRVLRSRWTIKMDAFLGPDICYLSLTPTYNPVTREQFEPGDWDCQDASLSLQRWQEVRDGDPLKLARTVVLPRVMPKDLNLSIPTAAKSVGYSTKMALNKAVNPDKSADEKVGR